MMAPRHERLVELLTYFPDEGVFKWNVDRSGGVKAGQIAGYIGGNGYIQIGIDGKKYYAHRLAVLYVNGSLSPEIQVDHRDGDRLNNKWTNLRLANNRQNQQNRSASTKTESGLKGVSRVSKSKRGTWRATIKIDGRTVHLGTAPTKEAASALYAKAARSAFGEFSRTS